MSEISAPPPTPPGATLPPAPPAAPPTATTLPATPGQAAIPQALIDAVVGARFDAKIINLTPQGLLTLQGNFGNVQLQLQSPLSLSLGDNLSLQLSGRGSLLQFVITNVNGEPTALAPRVGASSVAGGIQGAFAPGAQGQPALQTGNFLTATLLRPAAGIAGVQLGGGQSSAVPSTTPQTGAPTAGATTSAIPTSPGGNVANPSLQTTPGTTSAGNNSGPATSLPSGTATPLQGQGSPTATPSTLPAGTQFTVQVTAVQPQPPGGASAIVPPTGQGIAAQGQTLTGIVTGATTGGQPIVETVLGPIAINAANAPPDGTRVSLTISSIPQTPPAIATTTDSSEVFLRQALFLSREWPSLTGVLETLEQTAPNAAQQVAQTAIPRLDANLATNILMFLKVLRGGDSRSWLGDHPTRVLQRLNPGALTRLNNDIGQLARIADDPSTGEWRLALVPFHNGEALDQIRILTRRQEEDDDEDDAANSATRFVVDVKLTRLGQIQLDGLVNIGRRRMDMVVRSDQLLSPEIKNDIRRLYEDSGEITGYRGGVGFQSQPANFIEVTPPLKPESGVGLMV